MATASQYIAEYTTMAKNLTGKNYPSSRYMVFIRMCACYVCNKEEQEQEDFSEQLYIGIKEGILVCQECLKKENNNKELFIYNMCLLSNVISWNLFKKFTACITGGKNINYEKINVPRSSGIIEVWRVRSYVPIRRSTMGDEDFLIPVTTQDERISKGITFDQFCTHNGICHEDFINLFKTIFVTNRKYID